MKQKNIYIFIPSSLLPKSGHKYFPGQWPRRDLTTFKLHASIFLLNLVWALCFNVADLHISHRVIMWRKGHIYESHIFTSKCSFFPSSPSNSFKHSVNSVLCSSRYLHKFLPWKLDQNLARMIAGKDQKATINGNLVPNCINKLSIMRDSLLLMGLFLWIRSGMF